MNEILGSYTFLLELRTLIKIVHIISVCVGIGCATALYIYAVKFFMLQNITKDAYKIFAFFSDVINYALIVIWLTGFGAMLNWLYNDPELLLNQKVWGKICIVIVLTINGVTVHKMILKAIRKNIGKTLFHKMSKRKMTLFVSTGVISSVSWYTACAVALTSSLNFQSKYDILFMTYGVVCLTTIVLVNLFAQALKKYFKKKGKVKN